MILFLTGFMGSGKSSIGALAARLAKAAFYDLDKYIEESTGKAVSRIFAEGGEALFRKAESECLKGLISSLEGAAGLNIVATGGGTPLAAENSALLRSKGLCIYLKASAAYLADTLMRYPGDRPLLKGLVDKKSLQAKIELMLQERSAKYEAAAHKIIEIGGKTCEEVAEELGSLSFSAQGKAAEQGKSL